MDLPILIAYGQRSGRYFKTEWYQPTLKNGKIPSLVVFRHPTINMYFYGIIYQTETPPEKNFKQTRDVNVFKAHCVCSDESGNTQITVNSNPRIYAYNENYKLMAMAFYFDSNYDVPPSIGGFPPSDVAAYYSVPQDAVLTRFPYVGIIDTPEFWENVKDLRDKFAFEIDNSTEGGGDGAYDDNFSDTIGLPDLTALNQNSISNTKFLTCYKMTPTQLSKLGDELWSENIFTQISNTVLKPTDFIVNLSLLPVDVGGVTKLIKAGKILLNGAEGTLISQQFIRVDCGTLEVKKKWGGAIDYQTDVSIFLPFIGEQSLNTNEVMGATLNVIYTVDILSGSCIASVRVIKDSLDAVLYQFTGNMASNYPITSADYATVFSGALQLAVGVGSLPSSGGVLSLVSATSNMLSGADVKRTGSLSSASGFMGIKKPYLILSRPIQSLPSEYNTFRGYVSNITLSLSECSGFTKIAEIHLENITATEAEISEIESLLKSGVIIK